MSASELAHPSLAALVEKRDQLSQAILAVEGLLKIGNGADFIESAIQAIVAKSLGTISVASGDDGRPYDDCNDDTPLQIRSDQFFGMSVMDAAVAYLSLKKRPQSAQEIIDAIKGGGYHFQASNPLPSVTSTLNRSHGSGGAIVRTGKNMFGLAEWYSGRPRTKKKNSPRDQSDTVSALVSEAESSDQAADDNDI